MTSLGQWRSRFPAQMQSTRSSPRRLHIRTPSPPCHAGQLLHLHPGRVGRFLAVRTWRADSQAQTPIGQRAQGLLDQHQEHRRFLHFRPQGSPGNHGGSVCPRPPLCRRCDAEPAQMLTPATAPHTCQAMSHRRPTRRSSPISLGVWSARARGWRDLTTFVVVFRAARLPCEPPPFGPKSHAGYLQRCCRVTPSHASHHPLWHQRAGRAKGMPSVAHNESLTAASGKRAILHFGAGQP